MTTQSTGPTKNKSFNECLKNWAKEGYEVLPKCEDCEGCLIDQDVYETSSNWLCERCFQFSQDNYSGTASHAQDAAAERRQMGIID